MNNSLLDTIMEQIDLSNIISKHESDYLTSQPKVKIVPDDLAVLIGVSQTMMLCQMDYLIKAHQDDDHLRDGRFWIYETYDDWKEQFPYWGLSKIRDILSRLEKLKLISTGNYNKMKGDNTKWYTINYDLIDKMIERYHEATMSDDTPSVENQQMPTVGKQQMPPVENQQVGLSKTNRPIPNISIHNISIPNISTPNNTVLEGSNFDEDCPPTHRLRARLQKLYGDNSEFITEMEEVIRYFFDQYEEAEGRPHPYIKSDASFNKPTRNIGEAVDMLGCQEGKCLVDRYFKSFWKRAGKGKLSYWHFGNWEILRHRTYEEGYGQSVADGIFGESETPFDNVDARLLQWQW